MGKPQATAWGYLKSPPEEVSAFILYELKRQAEVFLVEEVQKAVIAIPAHFDINQRQAVKDAATIAGVEAVRLLNEATAAGLVFAHRRRNRQDMNLLVFDMGAGTLDVSIINFGGGVIEVLSIEGDSALGGLDFDQVIIDYVLEKIGKEMGSVTGLDSFQRLILAEMAERAKIDLTTAPVATIFLPGFLRVRGIARDLTVDIGRSEFERRSEKLIDRIMKIVSTALTAAKISTPGAFLLVGNGGQMPIVRNKIKKSLNIEPVGGVDPKLCVAEGAAIMAGVLMGEIKDVLLLDVISGSLGIGLEDDRYQVLIEKNTTFPVDDKSQIFSTSRDNQNCISVPIYQGENPKASENTFLGMLKLEGISPVAAGVPKIKVSFSVDANSIISCKAKDLQSRSQEISLTLRSAHALTLAEIKSKVERFGALQSI